MRYLTIEREYGSGGTIIAEELAKRCNVPCYGEEILEEAAERMHTCPDAIRESEERATNSVLYSIFLLSKIGEDNPNMLPREGELFVEEQRVIQDFARRGDAIFVGHCAAEAIGKENEIIRVYIYADTATKHERIRSEYKVEEKDIVQVEKKMNRRRANYYYANTQKKWDDLKQYDIVIDSSKLGIDGSVALLEGLFSHKTR